MDFLKLASERHSVRNFLPEPPSREKIERILEAARLAPSAVNLQPWHFFICESDEAKNAIRRCYQRDWFQTAPIYIIVCADPEVAWHRPEDGKIHSDIDAAIAAEHICLAAAAEGLGTCWVCRFNHGGTIPAEKLERIFEQFYRLDPERGTEGSGLGLAIAKQIVALHKGEITARSREGLTVFAVTLPIPCGSPAL